MQLAHLIANLLWSALTYQYVCIQHTKGGYIRTWPHCTRHPLGMPVTDTRQNQNCLVFHGQLVRRVFENSRVDIATQ